MIQKQVCRVGDIHIGSEAHPLVLIAGPCVLEDESTNRRIAGFLRDLADRLQIRLIFKGSFDKANRTSITSPRGPGLDRGLRMLCGIRREFDVPVTTDIHDPAQAEPAAGAVDLLQIPAFLCRQTDLLLAAAATGRPVNVKKGQFMSPAEMIPAVRKLADGGCRDILLTERGTFFGYQRLVNDFIGLGDLMEIGPPVCFDATHSTQLPGAGAGVTAGRPERAALLAGCAAAAGVDAIFMECHPDPPHALSDAATQQPLDRVAALVAHAVRIHAAGRTVRGSQ
ncbi:MAG: 3-deoxy-8-phosphooctulonate synthase [Phycisphaeraceae bacterium]|nr:3-deoxy-8-phosphooctulonate synthase [Phycisphaeraceae bacterium]